MKIKWNTCNFDVHVVVQQEVLSFEVPVHDFPAVAIFHCRQDLPELAPRLGLAQAPVAGQVIWETKPQIKSTKSALISPGSTQNADF